MKRDIIVVGASAGGVSALQYLCGALPADLPAVVAVVLHRGAWNGGDVSTIYGKAGQIRVREAKNDDRLERGTVYFAPLSGAYLSGADLHGANLSSATLDAAYLSRTNLSEVNLYRAFLRETFLDGANLRGANLGESTLVKADLSKANLSRNATPDAS